MRIFYASGPGSIATSHQHWREGAHDPNLTALTYSGQFCDFCKAMDADAYIVSHASEPTLVRDGKFTIAQMPKPDRHGYHVSQILYGLQIFLTAVKFGADYAVIQSGTTHPFMLWLFRLAGIKVIPVLHNTIWPAGYSSAGFFKRIIRKLDGLFYRWGAHAVIGVSPECLRQVAAVAHIAESSPKLIEMRGQFSREYFEAIPKPVHGDPFLVMFAGRIFENKGVFDLIEIARRIESDHPGLVKWDICGAGPDLEEMTHRRDGAGLESVVNIRGHVFPAEMQEVIARSHAAIVPTRSTFEEGMALAAVEPVLANRPVISCSVVPASEVLGSACLKARTDDVQSYAEQVLRLATNEQDYLAASAACDRVKEQFLNRNLGFAAGLGRAFVLGVNEATAPAKAASVATDW
jgi:glycosyltransferase involved in cell wall biosynthesis